jgi:hypothetical protein
MSYNQFVYDIPTGILTPPDFPAGCVVHFRPQKGWKGEYGFDWLRIDDVGIFGDTHYAKIMGRYETSKGIVCDDLNGWTKMTKNNADYPNVPCSFVNNIDSYRDLLNHYYPIVYTIPWKMPDPKKTPKKGWKGEKEKTNYNYYVPVMTLVKGKKADLNLHVEIEPKKTPPKRIDVKQHQSDGTYLTVSGTASPKNGKYPVTVECTGEFSEFQYIDALAIYDDPASGQEIEKLCGQLRIVPNDQKPEAKIVFIKVQMDIGNGLNEGKKNISEMNKLNEILSQSYTIISSTSDEFITITTINGFEITSDGGKYRFKSTKHLLQTLVKELKLSLNVSGLDIAKYDDYINVFLIDEKCIDENGTGANGVTANKTIVLFNTRGSETIAHEVLHGLSLHHPFVSKDGTPYAPKALYTYKALQTENIMDYSHLKKEDRISTWYWQWRVIWEELGIYVPYDLSNVIYPFDYNPKDSVYENLA